MYELDNGKCYNSQYFTDWASNTHIKSSTEAAIIWRKLENDGVLLHENENGEKKKLGNPEWARLCIAYCFANVPVNKWEKPKDANGTEIPSFNTMFNQAGKAGEEKFWLAYISQRLFKDTKKPVNNKRELQQYIQYVWHNGAINLWNRYERALKVYDDNIAEAKKVLFHELAVLTSQQRTRFGVSGSLKPDEIIQNLNKDCDFLKMALEKTVGKSGSIEPEYSGVRYDCFRVQFDRFIDLENYHKQICSELGKGDDGVRYERIEGAANTWHINVLRDKTTWQNFGKNEFQAALSQFPKHEAFNLPVLIGINERGQPVFQDLAKAVHSFVAGKTGSGKSVYVHSLLHSLLNLNPPKQVQVVILDPKKTEYQDFINKYQHIRGNQIITDTDEMEEMLAELVDEVENRNDLLQAQAKRNISELSEELMTARYILVVVDEVANLLSRNKKAEDLLCQLAEKARSAGVFLLLSTQTPNSEIFSQRLRANITTRVAFSVVNASASKIVLDETGAEKLSGSGDHLVKWNGGKTQFLHGYNLS